MGRGGPERCLRLNLSGAALRSLAEALCLGGAQEVESPVLTKEQTVPGLLHHLQQHCLVPHRFERAGSPHLTDCPLGGTLIPACLLAAAAPGQPSQQQQGCWGVILGSRAWQS